MNNRQVPRRRGRGNNNRTQNNNRNGYDNNNRIDNRARGNAAQMLEKYKKLAQDTQLNGDRVQAEYFHQFADHYFRVLADFKGRQEVRQDENRQPRGEWRNEEREGGEERDWRDEERDTSDNGGNEIADGEREDREDRRPQRQDRPERNDRPERAERPARQDRNDRQDRPERQERPEQQARPERNDRQPRNNNDRPRRERPERDGNRAVEAEPAGLDLAVLPPAIGVPSNDVDAAPDAEAAPVRKPRARKPKVVETAAAAE